MLFMLLLLQATSACTGQNPADQRDTTNQKQKFVPPLSASKAGISVGYDLPEGGYLFSDDHGLVINTLSQKEIYDRNPYKKAYFKRTIDDGKAGNFQWFNVDSLSVGEIKKGLPKTLKHFPSDKLLSKTSSVTAALTSVNYDWQNPLYLMVTYAIELFERDGSSLDWVETTIHVYDRQGKLVSYIVDNHSIQGMIISPDGKYMLANKIISRMGDGVGESYIGLVVYDVAGSKFLGTIGSEHNAYYLNVTSSRYSNNLFLLYFNSYPDLTKTSEFTPLILIIDPEKRAFYQKKNENPNHNAPDPPLKNSPYFGEDLSTFQVLHF